MDVQHRYNLRLSVSIEKQEGRPDGNNGVWWQQTQERLSVDQTMSLGAMDFLGVTTVLAQLHDMVQQLPRGEVTQL